MESEEVMPYIIKLVSNGEIDPYAEGLALLHGLGKKVSVASMTEVMQSSGMKMGTEQKGDIGIFVRLFNSFGFTEPTWNVFLAPVDASYSNPFTGKSPGYKEDDLRTAITQYDILLMLSQAAVMLNVFQQMTEAIEKQLGPPKSSGGDFKKDALEMLEKFGRREKFDPYLHAVLLCYGVEKQVDEKTVTPVLEKLGIKVDSKRLQEACDIVKKSNIPEIVKTQFAIVRKAG